MLILYSPSQLPNVNVKLKIFDNCRDFKIMPQQYWWWHSIIIILLRVYATFSLFNFPNFECQIKNIIHSMSKVQFIEISLNWKSKNSVDTAFSSNKYKSQDMLQLQTHLIWFMTVIQQETKKLISSLQVACKLP